MDRLTITPVANAIGAEIGGIDLSEPLPPETIARLRQVLLDRLVIFFRDQKLTPDAFMTFANAFGTPVAYPMLKGVPGYPFITEVIKLEHEHINFGGVWHTDTAYLETPPMGSMLYALEVPPQGGDTLFANQYAAYDHLSAPLQGFLDGLTAVNASAKEEVAKTRADRIKAEGGETPSHEFVAEHPAVRTHPETGRRSLYVNRAHTTHFKGMTQAESEPILNYLFDHQVRPEFTCRFTWRPGSLAFWDNRASLHFPINDYHGHRRVMHRITLQGDRPF